MKLHLSCLWLSECNIPGAGHSFGCNCNVEVGNDDVAGHAVKWVGYVCHI